HLQSGEGCDDGNTANGDGCNSTCLKETGFACNATAPGLIADPPCATGICDLTNGPTGTCEVAGCGDNHLQSGEGCDDGNTTNGDGCDSACLKETGTACNATAPGLIGDPSCATGICDLTNGPTGTCEVSGCGDNHLQAGEGCDDGNTANGDGCNSSCLKETGTACNATAPGLIADPSCATGICDLTNGPTGTCEVSGCGDNHLQAGEGCDDGNTANGDGCDSACLKETGTACNATAPGLIGDPSCATGICDLTNGPTGTCEVSGCGDNHLQAGEGCDDGNTANGDGCNSSCLKETGTACNATAPGLIADPSCATGICDLTNGPTGTCEVSGCGDNHLDAGEGCDDGNTANGDGCNSSCLKETGTACNATAPGLIADPSCATGICDLTNGPTGTCEVSGCGDNHLDAGEGCDDGNTTNGDGCDSTCFKETGTACNATAPGLIGDPSCATGICDLSNGPTGTCEVAGCGDNHLDAGEGCDDGNTTSGDGCNSSCLKETGTACNATAPGLIGDPSCASGICDLTNGPTGTCEVSGCGDNHLQAGEGCDDGNTTNGDGCNSSCLKETGTACNATAPGLIADPSCATGICDLTNGPTGTCEVSGCGDNHLQAGEGCDDGNTANGDGCNSSCLKETGTACNATAPGLIADPSCATGICDLTNGPTGTCEVAGCGDNHLQSGEGCDDGNTANGDGCNSSCFKETGFACNATAPGLIADPSCATGICDLTNGPTGTCEVAGCGDNHLQSGEGCDDGNTANGDGCDSTCFKETGTACNATAPGLIGDPSCATGTCDLTNGPTGTCEVPGCGDNHLQADEGCDDGNTLAGDGCNTTCRVETGDLCNDTAPGLIGDLSCASGSCDLSGGAPGICEAPGCGDGNLAGTEGCDDGNSSDGDGCSSACLVETGRPCNDTAPGLIADPSCATGICDLTNGPTGTCEVSGCGDNHLQAGEGCDDGNTTNGDGCSSSCLKETGTACNATAPGLIGDPSCVSGICDLTNGPTGTCEVSGCGDNHLQAGEGCDDGNIADGDGCNSSCLKETGTACNATAPGLIGDPSCATGICDLTNGPTGTCEVSGCGDNHLQSGEGCDDGNTANGDGCDSACLKETGTACNATAPGLIGDPSCASGICDLTNGPTGTCEVSGCGDNHLQSGEGCDDGNTTNGDGCDSACLKETGTACNATAPGLIGDPSCATGICDLTNGPTGTCELSGCGDNHLQAGEGCDDGNTANGDGCNSSCLKETGTACNATAPGLIGDPSCASGICDLTNGPTGTCEVSGCGDNHLQSGEGCDDGNTANGDGCNSSCLKETGTACNATAPGLIADPSCATGICDLTNGPTGTCEISGCGDNHLDAGEGCDDGNNADGDGCNSSCLKETGNACNATAPGLIGDPSCATGICDLTNGPTGTCEVAGCGDNHLQSGEGCDDGNNANGDGCDSACLKETGTACNATAPGLVGDPSCATGTCDLTNGPTGTCEVPGCGDNHLQADEGCDDGNTLAGDGCNTTCRVETGELCNDTAPGLIGDLSCASGSCDLSGGAPGICEAPGCGDGNLADTEGCDDGNSSDGDGCSTACLVETGRPCNATAPGLIADPSCATGICDLTNGPTGTCEVSGCGDNHLQAGEGCDDGNTTNGDGCSSSCLKETGTACNATAPGLIGDPSCVSGICDLTNGPTGTCEVSGCGDNHLDAGEGCDDGNIADGDGCSSACRKETGTACNATAPGLIGDLSCATGICDQSGGAPGVCEPFGCGDGHVQSGEGCDDGANVDGDGCSALCLVEDGAPCNDLPTGETGDPSCASGVCDLTGGAPGVCEPYGCGDGHLDAGEGCDDGDTVDGDGCNAQCLVEEGAPCNDQPSGEVGDASCASGACDLSGGAPGVCEPSGCGDGALTSGEGCDDGNTTPGDGCSASCRREDGEPCNDVPPGLTGDSSCASGVCDLSGGTPGVCEPVGCGDDHLQTGEGCDDGNTADGDGCSARCLVEDGEPCNEQSAGATGDPSCASGVCDLTGGAPGVCEPAGCGDGRLDPAEGCDDGNTADGDGCSALCLVEDGEPCSDQATGQTGDPSCASGVCDLTGGAPGVCEPAGCGDGRLDAGEECDDGNTDLGDGCDDLCQTENPCGTCLPETPVCDLSTDTCVECLVSADCPAPATCTAAHACSLATPVVVTPADAAVINDATPEITGTGPANVTINVYVDGAPVGTTTTDGAGNWTFTPTTDLALGAHAVHATATVGTSPLDVTSADSNTNTFTVVSGCLLDSECPGDSPVCDTATGTCERCLSDVDCPAGATCNASKTCELAAPVVVFPADESVINQRRPAISGTSAPGALVEVTLNGTVIGTTTADASGNWTLTPNTDLALATHTVSAVATVGSGSLAVTSPRSNVNEFTIVDGCLTDADCGGATPACNTLTGLCVRCVYDTHCPEGALCNGANLCTLAPPVIVDPEDEEVVNTRRPPIVGTSVPNARITVFIDGEPVGETTTDGNGNWTFTPTTDLADGPHTAQAVATLGSGDLAVVSPPSEVPDFTVGCLTNADCSGDTPICQQTTHTCVECLTGTDCPAATPVCALLTNECVPACTSDSQCAAPAPFCAPLGNPRAGECVPCLADSACSGATPHCNVTDDTCVECLADSDCSNGERCYLTTHECVPCLTDNDCRGNTPFCETASHECRGCTTDGDCGGATPLCSFSGALAGTCVACRTNNDCTGGSPICDADTGTCRPCDPSGSDCGGDTPACETAGTKAGRCVECTAQDEEACTGDTPVCNTTPSSVLHDTCVECVVDADCPDTAPTCNTAIGQCTGPCQSDAECAFPTPVCAPQGNVLAGVCVECVTDGQCAQGLRCDNTASDTCVECLSHSDCPAAERCDPASHTCRGCVTDLDCPVRAPVCDPDTWTCRGCTTNAQCHGVTPQCIVTGVDSGQCAECSSNADCPAEQPICDEGTHTCRVCGSDNDCTGDARVCATTGTLAGRCVQCTDDDSQACTGATPVCNTSAGPNEDMCVVCLGNADCPSTLPFCDTTTNQCRGECTDDSQCGGDTPACAPLGHRKAGTCVGCTGDQHCPATERCDTAVTDTCVECVADQDCAVPTPFCHPTSRGCVECLGDSDCPSAEAPVCDPTTHACRPCGNDGECKGDAPACVLTGSATGQCAECTGDSHCPTSAPHCNTEAHRCQDCTANEHCPFNLPACDVTTGECGACTEDSQCAHLADTPVCGPDGKCQECTEANAGRCTGDTPVCNSLIGQCVGCVTDDDCGENATCNNGTCVQEVVEDPFPDENDDGVIDESVVSGSCGSCASSQPDVALLGLLAVLGLRMRHGRKRRAG
ncbi:MAG: DUF4215 domain-containing protein, partial [Myxococcota bacterium]